MPELHHRADHCCSRSKSLLAAEKVGKGRSTDASYLRRHLKQRPKATSTAVAKPLFVLLATALFDLQPAKRKLLRDGARNLIPLLARDGGLLRGQLKGLKAQGRRPVREGATTLLLLGKLQNELKQLQGNRLLDIVGLDSTGNLLEERLRFPVPPGGLAVIP